VDTAVIITNLAPAIMLLIVAMIVRLFPPTRDNNPLIASVPDWWKRDQQTWSKAHKMLSKYYLIYSVVLACCCVAIMLLETVYGATIGYVLLVVFFVLANFQVRRFMSRKVK